MSKQISISEVAQVHFAELLKEQDEGTNIRVFVVNPGTPNAECGVSYCPKEAIEDTDTEISFKSFSVYIDQLSYPFLEAAEIDLETDKMGSQLTLKAPNAKARKVTADAPLIDHINYFIQNEINPSLAGHGGYVSLIEITEAGEAILEFGGGCNGCSMVDMTLKNGIEGRLLEAFPEQITKVLDLTEHKRGSHSFY